MVMWIHDWDVGGPLLRWCMVTVVVVVAGIGGNGVLLLLLPIKDRMTR